MARGLRNAARMIEDGVLERMRRERYSSFTDTQLGRWGLAYRPCHCLPLLCASSLRLEPHASRLPPFHWHHGVAGCRDIVAGKLGFKELEEVALQQEEPWAAGLQSGSAELYEIILSRYVR